MDINSVFFLSFHRVETSSQGTNSYVQPQKTNNVQNNKNYYNSTNNQAYDPTQYDSYYSIYDEDVELYRDVDYSQPQYNTQKPSIQQQSTYRPTTQSTQQPPQRETYITQTQQPPQQQQTQQPIYERPSQVYNEDYSDDELIAQVSVYIF